MFFFSFYYSITTFKSRSFLAEKCPLGVRSSFMDQRSCFSICDPAACCCVQIQQWEQNLEKLNLDLFRLRCYLSSLQGSELPNPKSLLAVASRPSKSMLGRLGVFSVSSFHALVTTFLHFLLTENRTTSIFSFLSFLISRRTPRLSSGMQSRWGDVAAPAPVSVRRKREEEGSAVLPESPGWTEQMQQGRQTLVPGNTPDALKT